MGQVTAKGKKDDSGWLVSYVQRFVLTLGIQEVYVAILQGGKASN